jgi:hypothetical protein
MKIVESNIYIQKSNLLLKANQYNNGRHEPT